MAKWRVLLAGSFLLLDQYTRVKVLSDNFLKKNLLAVFVFAALAAGARADEEPKLGTVIGIDLGTTCVPALHTPSNPPKPARIQPCFTLWQWSDFGF